MNSTSDTEVFGIPYWVLFMCVFFCFAVYIAWNKLAAQKQIRIWVIAGIIVCAGFFSIYEYRIAYKVRYTIGTMLGKIRYINTRRAGTTMMNVYCYSVHGVYYEDLFYAPNGFVINIDKKYVIRYSIDYPSKSKILLDHPVECYYRNIPDTGWSKIPSCK